MKIYKAVFGFCIFVNFLLISWSFVFAIIERELVIALLCPAVYAALRGMVEVDRLIIAEKEEKEE